MAKILLTAFEPFGGAATNPTISAVALARAELENFGFEIDSVVLPVEFEKTTEMIGELVQGKYDVIIATGLAEGRKEVTPERVAININDARFPDNAGTAIIDEPVIQGAAAAWFSTLPIKAIVAHLTEQEIPARVSNTAGTYVCNHVFALLMHEIECAGYGTKAGFIHIPAEYDLAPNISGRALALAAQVALVADADIKLTGGVES